MTDLTPTQVTCKDRDGPTIILHVHALPLEQTSETGRSVSLLALRDPHLTGYPHPWGKATMFRSRLDASVIAGELFNCQLSKQHAFLFSI